VALRTRVKRRPEVQRTPTAVCSTASSFS